MPALTLRLLLTSLLLPVAALSARADTMPSAPSAAPLPTVASFAARAEKREPLSVVFFGGSLTWGANASDPQRTSYRGRMMTYLLKKYPNTPFTFHDAAIGGTGSMLGMFRLERDVLAYKPDFVFLDYTVNDGAEDTDIYSLASYEHIVRELVSRRIPVMPVLMLFRWHAEKPDAPRPPRHEAHLKLAAAYGLPVGNTLDYIRLKAKSGVPITTIWPLDGAHPCDEGYQFMFEAVRDRFEQAITETTPTVLPTTSVFEDLYPKTTRQILTDKLPEGWTRELTYRTALWFDGMASRWMGDVATASFKHKSPALEVEFTGSMVGFFGERNGLAPAVKIWIDGQPVQMPKAAEGNYLWPTDTSKFAPAKKGSGNLFGWTLISRKLTDGKHTLRIEPVWEGADKDAELRIESICSAGR